MRTIMNLCHILAFIGVFVWGRSVAAQSFEYANLFNSKHLIAIQITPPLVASSDRAVDARFCKPVEEFVCVTSEWFNFAVPFGRARLPTQWEQAGNEYKLVGSEKLVLLGIRRDVLRIESVQKGLRHRFLYSRRDGLVGFSSEVDGQPVTFVSQRTIGFGASASSGSR
jgi:hypothetical protein